jgi:hypothetical protein
MGEGTRGMRGGRGTMDTIVDRGGLGIRLNKTEKVMTVILLFQGLLVVGLVFDALLPRR